MKIFLTAAMSVAVLCTSHAEVSGKEEKPKKYTVTASLKLDSFSGVIAHPLPPDNLTQKVVSHKLVATTRRGKVVGSDSHEVGTAEKPIVALKVSSQHPLEVCFTVEIEMSPGLGPVSAKSVPLLTSKEKAYFTGTENFYEPRAAWFRSWIVDQGLKKGENETAEEFAMRLLQFMRDNFTYAIPEDQAAYNEKARNHPSGELGLIVEQKTGECWALSRVYTNVLRANGIPSRQISGRMLGDGGHHVRAQIYLDGIGWMHVEVSGAVFNKQGDLETCFGRGPGNDYVAMNDGINFLIKGPRGDAAIGTFSSFGLGNRDGDWNWELGTWQVAERN